VFFSVFDITKELALAISAGARVFWNKTNRRITTAGNYQVGIATLAALAADATVRVCTERVPASGA
jgi:predicted RecA/RadA family phage recombinase